MYLYELVTEWWWLLPMALAAAGLIASVAIPPSSDALDLVQRSMEKHGATLAHRAREYQKLRRMELPR